MLKHSGDPGLTRHVLNATVRIMPLGDAVFARPGLSRTTNAGLTRSTADRCSGCGGVCEHGCGGEPAFDVYDDRGLIAV